MAEVQQWEIGRLKLRPRLIWSFAMSSLKVRIGSAFLTTLTITTATAFMMYLLTAPRNTEGSATEQQSWMLMLVLALLVSAAGVLNTMLMSVTQRYREIGTIKCLGALDALVLMSVLLEAAVLGLIGAVIGAVIGLVVALILAVADLGLGLFGDGGISLLWLPVNLLAVFLVGMALTTFGAAVPAYIAAKMPPIEAMRGEK